MLGLVRVLHDPELRAQEQPRLNTVEQREGKKERKKKKTKSSWSRPLAASVSNFGRASIGWRHLWGERGNYLEHDASAVQTSLRRRFSGICSYRDY